MTTRQMGWVAVRLLEFHCLHPEVDIGPESLCRNRGNLSERVDIPELWLRELGSRLMIRLAPPLPFD